MEEVGWEDAERRREQGVEEEREGERKGTPIIGSLPNCL